MKINLLVVLFFISLFGMDCQVLSPIVSRSNQLALAVNKVIVKALANYSETVYFMSPDPRKLNSNLIRDFQHDVMAKAFSNQKVVYRQELTSNVLTTLRHKRRMMVFLAENFEDFVNEHKTIKSEIFMFHGLYVVVLVNGRILEIKNIFKLMWTIQIYNVIVMFEENNEVLVYTFFPFNAMKCDDTTPVLINRIFDGNFLNGSENIFPDKMENLFNCPVRLSMSMSAQPFIIPTFFSNGSYKLEGGEVEFIETLAKILNFKIKITFLGDEGYIYENGSAAGSYKALLDGEADISMGNWAMKQIRLNFFDCTNSYSILNYVLLVPPGARFTPFENLICPFAPTVWGLVLVVYLFGFGIIIIIRRQKVAFRNFVFGSQVQHPMLNMFSGFIGGMQTILPRKNFARFLLMCFLLYSLVIRTLYQASYFQIIKSGKEHKPVQSINEIVQKDFKIYVSHGNADILYSVDAIKKRFLLII